MKKPLYNYNGYSVYIQKEEYINPKSVAILIFLEDGTCLDVISKNFHSKKQNLRCFFLDIYRFKRIEEFLLKNKIAIKTNEYYCIEDKRYPCFCLLE